MWHPQGGAGLPDEGQLLLSIDGNSHTTYIHEEAEGYRVVVDIQEGGMHKGAKHPSTSCSRPAPAGSSHLQSACSSRLQSKTLNMPGAVCARAPSTHPPPAAGQHQPAPLASSPRPSLTAWQTWRWTSPPPCSPCHTPWGQGNRRRRIPPHSRPTTASPAHRGARRLAPVPGPTLAQFCPYLGLQLRSEDFHKSHDGGQGSVVAVPSVGATVYPGQPLPSSALTKCPAP